MWVQIAIWVITTVIGMLLAPKPPKPASATPGNLDVPVAESGKAHPGAVRHARHPAGQRGLVRRRQDHRDSPVVRQRRQEMIVTHDDAKAFGYCNAGPAQVVPA
jgi:hypothetical protein